jgi:methylenetetrahydrofolate dehydrogenase (NADP+)/methenyltetrahydrofolate cyclohydrolase
VVSARILDGKALAAQLQTQLSARSAALVGATGHAARLAVLTFDEIEASTVYAASVVRAAGRVGIEASVETPAAGATAADVATRIAALNADPRVAGIVVAEPLPQTLADFDATALIDPGKDVDGQTPVNAGRLARGEPALVPATALAVMEILRAFEVPVAGRRAVVIGRSSIIGRPAAALLLAADATVVICHRQTPDLAAETRRAEILVVAAGSPGLVTADMVDPRATVIDCGITPGPDGVVGDVAPGVEEVVAAITPVPGGVGPVTSMMLARQTLDVAERMSADAAVG